MVVFNDLRITPDGKNLLIEAMVAPYKYFKDLYISSISIDTEDSFSTGKPSTKAIEVYRNQDFSIKECSVDITPDMLNLTSFNDHIFYVYITVAGNISIDTPSNMYNECTLGVVLNWQPIYQQGINHMKNVVNGCCGMPKVFIDYILRLKAFELALKTAQYQLANDRFKKWFTKDTISFNSFCDCN